MPSSSGQATACSAAMRARSGPLATAVPIMALPGSPITVRTSSKSTFTWPGTLMISAMPPTAFFSTSLAWAKASSWVMSSPSTSSSFSFSTTISESTLASSSDRPASALSMRRPPSQSKGLVTTPTVRMPISLATRAITGAAPVPVPPPMPAVMNSMCAPSIAARMSSIASSAAWPFSGLLPAPRPLTPSWMVRWAALRVRACASVLAQMNSTPPTLRSIMCSTALPPPPPTPITLIWVPRLNSSTSIISMVMCVSPDFCSCLNAGVSMLLFMGSVMKVGRCIAIAPACAFADSPVRGAWRSISSSEVPHDEVLDAAEGRLHGSVLLAPP
jgi:hypothetical protein